MKKRLFALLLATMMLFLASCSRESGEATQYGFIDPQTGTEYFDVKPLGLYALKADGDYITVGEDDNKMTYSKVQFENPLKFLCYEDSGEFLLLRSEHVEEPTLATFDPIAAHIYDETNTVYVTMFYADDEYLPEENKGKNPTEDTDLCRLIASSIEEGESVSVPAERVNEEDMFFIRLLSQKHPGLYYLVVFFGDTSGRYYLSDRAAGKTVYCPREIIARMVGE